MNRNILVLGGTQMLGRDFVEKYTTQYPSDNIYIANRGITNPTLFPLNNHIFFIQINRDISETYKNIPNIFFDVVIDFSCYNIKQFMPILQENIRYKKYLFISTTAAVDDKLLLSPDHSFYNYAINKKQIEDFILTKHLPNFTIVRPVIVYGENDYTGRSYIQNGIFYWTHNNEPIINNEYFVYVGDLTRMLIEYIKIETNISVDTIKAIRIDGTGMKHYGNV
jgi:hypothetical protein